MIKGTHNSLTGYPLKGWQKYFKWLIQPWSQCQDEEVINQFLLDDVKLFDIQVSVDTDRTNINNTNYIGSHGIAYYNVKANMRLWQLDNWAKVKDINEKVYIILGLDNHFHLFDSNITPQMRIAFRQYVIEFQRKYPNLTLIRAFIEDPWEIVYENHGITDNMIERYWSLQWAKSMKKHWWQFYYYLPCPRLWKWIYGKQWDKEAEESGKRFYVTDFV